MLLTITLDAHYACCPYLFFGNSDLRACFLKAIYLPGSYFLGNLLDLHGVSGLKASFREGF
jgi:hypothetical protein